MLAWVADSGIRSISRLFMERFRPENLDRWWTRRSAIAAAAGLAAAQPQAGAQKPAAHPLWPMDGPPVLRGAVIAQRRRRTEVDGDTFGGGAAALPAYGAAEFDALAEAGANLVVMSFPELWTVGRQHRLDPVMAAQLQAQLKLAREAGLYVVVGLRSGPGRSDFVFHRDAAGSWFPARLIVDSIWTNLDEQAAWAEMCADAAKMLAGQPEIAGLNIMVEPDPNVSGTNRKGQRLGAWTPKEYAAEVSRVSDWRRVARDCAMKVRTVAPDLPILISPPAFARTDFLPVMGQPPVAGTVWCVHDYEPRDYTHQSRNSRGIAIFSEGGADTFANRIDAAKRQGAPVFLGEFGAARWGHELDTYYSSRIAACEARGVGWAAFRWPTSDAAYEQQDDTFNLTWGGAAGDITGSPMPTLRGAWAKNSARLSGAGLPSRNN